MNVLEPEKIWVEGRCYRFFENSEWKYNRNITEYVEDQLTNDEHSNEELEDDGQDIEITPYFDKRRLHHKFPVAKEFFPHIMGARHATRKKIESDTGTEIKTPPVEWKNQLIIVGTDRKGIIAARRRIDLIIQASRRRIRPTHFISIPMNDEHIMQQVELFKNNVLKDIKNNINLKVLSDISEEIFMPPIKLHLTMCMLILLDDNDRKIAADMLIECQEQIIKPILEKHGPITIKLEGVECMNDDPENVSIIFANVKENKVLQTLANEVSAHFLKSGLAKDERRDVKLHATLMNTRYAEISSESCRIFFDARSILEKYKNTCFGEKLLNEMQISIRSTGSSSEYYKYTQKIEF